MATTRNDTGVRTFTALTDLEAYRRVKFSAPVNTVEQAGAADVTVGVTVKPARAGRHIPVALLTKEGTMEVTAVAAIAFGDNLEAGADGKVDTEGSSLKLTGLIAMAPASGDGAISEAAPFVSA